jgi:hypothetical protein
MTGYELPLIRSSFEGSKVLNIGLITIFKLLLLMPFSLLYMRNRNNRSINIYVCN